MARTGGTGAHQTSHARARSIAVPGWETEPLDGAAGEVRVLARGRFCGSASKAEPQKRSYPRMTAAERAALRQTFGFEDLS
jgi:hypothetical protein